MDHLEVPASYCAEDSYLTQPLPTLNGTTVTLAELRSRFYDSDIGLAMREQTYRFAKTHPLERALAREHLGNDVCPVDHQLELADVHLPRIIDAEIQAGTLFSPSDDDRALLALAATFHDIGESEHESLIEFGMNPVGDIPAGRKTDTQRREEARIRIHLMLSHFPELDHAFIARVEGIIMHTPLTGDEHLHEIMEAAHNLQTYDTATRAEQSPLVGTNTPEGVCISSLAIIVKKAAHKHLEPARYFQAVNDELSNNPLPGESLYTHAVTSENAKYHTHCCNAVAA